MMLDAEGKMVCEVRGFGWIQQFRTHAGALIYQEHIGQALADGFNKEFKKVL